MARAGQTGGIWARFTDPTQPCIRNCEARVVYYNGLKQKVKRLTRDIGDYNNAKKGKLCIRIGETDDRPPERHHLPKNREIAIRMHYRRWRVVTTQNQAFNREVFGGLEEQNRDV